MDRRMRSGLRSCAKAPRKSDIDDPRQPTGACKRRTLVPRTDCTTTLVQSIGDVSGVNPQAKFAVGKPDWLWQALVSREVLPPPSRVARTDRQIHGGRGFHLG